MYTWKIYIIFSGTPGRKVPHWTEKVRVWTKKKGAELGDKIFRKKRCKIEQKRCEIGNQSGDARRGVAP